MGTIAEGEAVELKGVVRTVSLLLAPLTLEPCVGHVTKVRVYTRLDHTGQLVQRLDASEFATFILETSAGPLIVADKPEVDLDLTWVHRDGTDDGRFAAFLAKRKLKRHYVATSLYEHAVVRPGDTVTMSGMITLEPFPIAERGFRELPTKTRLVGYGKHPLRLRA